MKPSADWFGELAPRADDGVAGQRLDRLPRALRRRSAITASSSPVTAFSTPTENAPTRPVSFAAPRIVVCAGAVGISAVGHVRRAARRAANAPGVEQAAAVAVVAVEVEAEDAGAFDEERPPLREERLERGQVDDGGIRFDLTEVGIHRAGQRQPGPQRVLQIEAERCVRIGRRARKRVARFDRLASSRRPRRTAPSRAASAID